jgi:hypothetical protein
VNLPILVVDDEPDVEPLFGQQLWAACVLAGSAFSGLSP